MNKWQLLWVGEDRWAVTNHLGEAAHEVVVRARGQLRVQGERDWRLLVDRVAVGAHVELVDVVGWSAPGADLVVTWRVLDGGGEQSQVVLFPGN